MLEDSVITGKQLDKNFCKVLERLIIRFRVISFFVILMKREKVWF